MSLIQQAEAEAEDGAGDAGVGSAAAPGSPTPASHRARLVAATDLVSAVMGELEPGGLDLLAGDDAVVLFQAAVGMERFCVALKTSLGGRIATSGVWRQGGHRDAAALVALLEGVSAGKARSTLELDRQLAELPATREAFRQGKLSGAKVTELAGAGVLDPDREAELVAGAHDQSLQVVKERAQRSRATSARRDHIAAARRIHRQRSFRSWIDVEGAFCYQGSDTADRGAQILAHIDHVAAGLAKAAKAAMSEDDQAEGHQAHRADAFFALVTGQVGSAGAQSAGAQSADDRLSGDQGVGGVGSGDAPVLAPDAGGITSLDLDPDAPGSDDGLDNGDDDDDDGFDGPHLGDLVRNDTEQRGPAGTDAGSWSIVTRPPTCSVMVRVDLAALLRGHAQPGELCEIDGMGPIPVPMAAHMANDSFLRFVFTKAGDISAVSHFGRTINTKLRTALALRDRCCVVPHCGISFGLEIDHIWPFGQGGPTNLDNLALLCHHHHFLKTHEGWILTKYDGTDGEGPRWTFEPQAPFGEEPDLGIDTPPGRARWRQSQSRMRAKAKANGGTRDTTSTATGTANTATGSTATGSTATGHGRSTGPGTPAGEPSQLFDPG